MTRPGAEFRAQRILTATPAQLIAMLYDAALADMANAIAAGESGDRQGWNTKLLHAQDVIMELRMSLNFEGGEIAYRLSAIYDWVHLELVKANVRRDTAAVARCIGWIEPLADAWKVSQKLVGVPAAAGASA